MAFLSLFQKLFEGNKKSLFTKARWVVEGLLCASRKNLQVIAQSLGKSDNQALNHFISDSVWDWSKVNDQVAMLFYRTIERLGPLSNLCLVIDESGNPKKGKGSVGVERQYCGKVGKTDNCQVGVFAALNCGTLTSIINAVLFLPKSWTSDEKRMDKVGVPNAKRGYKTKIEIALALILDVRKRLKIIFQWVVFDAFYGRDMGLLRELHRLSITFMAQIPESHKVCLKDFDLKVPKPKSNRGKKPKKRKPTRASISVKAYAKKLRGDHWTKLKVRTASTGMLEAYFHRVPVWVFDEQAMKKCRLVLMIRKELNGDLSFHLTNSKAHLQRLAFMQGQRYFVEQAFREAKQELGMDQYQVRGYCAWHKHMALVMMAQLFVQEEKILANPKQVVVTTQDIVRVIKFLLLPTLKIEQVIHQIEVKNKTVLSKIRYLTK